MMKTLLILIGMIGLGFTSCDSADKKVDLTGMKWVLQTLDGKKWIYRKNGVRFIFSLTQQIKGQ